MGNTLFSSDSERSTRNNFRFEEADFLIVNRDRYNVFPGLPPIRDREVVSQMARLSLDQSGYEGRGSVFFKNHFLNNQSGTHFIFIFVLLKHNFYFWF